MKLLLQGGPMDGHKLEARGRRETSTIIAVALHRRREDGSSEVSHGSEYRYYGESGDLQVFNHIAGREDDVRPDGSTRINVFDYHIAP